jgi:hypothetical protein
MAETLAVKVTDWPKMAGFDEEITAVAVFALFTTMLCCNAVAAV